MTKNLTLGIAVTALCLTVASLPAGAKDRAKHYREMQAKWERAYDKSEKKEAREWKKFHSKMARERARDERQYYRYGW